MMLFRFLFILFLATFASNYASAQTCESLFNTSVLSRFTVSDQETLASLARRQVKITSNFTISTMQKQNILKHLDEQVEEFIAGSQLNTVQERVLRQEYRALVFQFKRELNGELDIQVNKLSEKQEVIKKQTEDSQNNAILEALFQKYNATEPIQVLRTLIEHRFDSANEKEFRFALNYFPDVNARIFGKTLLEFAISEQNFDKTKILLEAKGIHIEAQPGHDSPLHLAIQRNSTEIVQLLITKGVDVNAKDKNGKAPIHWAIEKPEFLDMLLQVPTLDINATNNLGKTALYLALYQLYSKSNRTSDDGLTNQINFIVKKLLLIPKIDLNIYTSNQTPFQIAMRTNNYDAVRLLIAHPSFNLNAKASDGETPLHSAVKSPEILKLLIDKGADINAKNGSNFQTPLHWAVSVAKDDFNSDTIKTLVDRGANVNTIDLRSETTFHAAILHATMYKQFQRVKLLLKAENVNLNLKGLSRFTVEEELLEIRNHIEPELTEFYKSRGLEK